MATAALPRPVEPDVAKLDSDRLIGPLVDPLFEAIRESLW
jgi:hypothetical protein